MTIKLKGSSAGSVSFVAPADTSPSGTDVSLTLPTTAGTAGQVLKNSATAGTLEFGEAGKVLQVVSAMKKNQSSTSSTTAVSTGLSLNITPVLQTSNIILTATIGAAGCSSNDFGVFFYFGLGSTPAVISDAIGDAVGSETSCTTHQRIDLNVRSSSLAMQYVHDHDSSSQLTYTLMYSMESGGGAAFLNRPGSAAGTAALPRTITVLKAMEVAT